MSKRSHRAAFEAKRTLPDLIAVSEAEAREIRAISDHHNDEYRSGLDDVDGRYRVYDEDDDTPFDTDAMRLHRGAI